MIAGPVAAMVAYGGVLWWMRRRFDLVCLLLIFLIGSVWRTVSIAYMDIAGPVPSLELFREIGGGQAAVPLVASYILFLFAFFWVFRTSRIRELAAIPAGGEMDLDDSRVIHARVSRLIFAGYATFLVFLVLELLRGGVIPLFAGIERYIFTNELAGPMHRMLVKYGMHISFVLGAFYAYGELLNGRPDRRFLALMVATFGYLLLVGNRFSAFYSHSTFFLMPWTAVVIRRRFSPPVIPPAGAVRESALLTRFRRMSRGRRILLQVTAGAMLLTMMGYGFYRSLVFTRNLAGEAALQNLAHRVLVLQGELWTATYERVFVEKKGDPKDAFDRVFVHPVWDPGRNTTLPYLMVLEIGDRAFPILDIGSTYSGGYPEILFELLGPGFGFVGVFIAAIILALMYRAILRAMIEQRYVRVLLLFWLAYLVLMFHFGGMLNTFANWKFAAKLAFAAFWLLFEAGRHRGRVPAIRTEALPA